MSGTVLVIIQVKEPVYVFDRNGNTFNEVGFLTSTNPDVYTDSDYFGHSVATSADGKTIFVGSYEGETGSINPNGQNPDYGIVHVFDREGNNFNEVGILTGTYASGSDDQFGKSVATSSDGKTIIVGAPRDESNNTESSTTGRFGVAYVFNREGNNFNEVGILTAGTNIDDVDNFGHSVATSSDGKTIIVGALYDEIGSTSDTGVVYVFDREGNNFNEVGILTGSYASDTYDQFGYSLATSADGKTIVVGASGPSTGTDWGTGDEVGIGTTNTGVVYVFDREGNNFNEVGILTGSYASDSHDQFGHSVATSADGKTIVVGARNDEINPSGISSTGLVYVFNRQGNNFNEVGIFTGFYTANADVNGDTFGHSVTISADGKRIIVGAPFDEHPTSGNSSGVVYAYDQERETYVFSDVNGNIGIGSAQPTAKLDVKGTLNVSGVSTFTSDILINGLTVGRGSGNVSTNTSFWT